MHLHSLNIAFSSSCFGVLFKEEVSSRFLFSPTKVLVTESKGIRETGKSSVFSFHPLRLILSFHSHGLRCFFDETAVKSEDPLREGERKRGNSLLPAFSSFLPPSHHCIQSLFLLVLPTLELSFCFNDSRVQYCLKYGKTSSRIVCVCGIYKTLNPAKDLNKEKERKTEQHAYHLKETKVRKEE